MATTLAPPVSTSAEPEAPPAPREERLGHRPALDGIRAVALIAVLFFHNEFAWMQGGFMAVSTFFTLSGFLITILLIERRSGRHRPPLREFWARRFRRLMPAALIALGFVLVLAAAGVWSDSQLRSLRGDVTAALFYVANWRFLFSGQSYAELFSAPSPVLHFWSLAIEEQFYVLYPILVAGGLAIVGRSRVKLGAVLGGLAAASVVACVLLAGDPSAVYYGTETRAAELLAGGILALVLLGRPTLRSAGARRTFAFLGVVGLVASIVVWVVARQSDGWIYRGGFAAFSLASVALVTGALQPGPLNWFLSRRPLVELGRISYGVYLFHWPVFLWLDERRLGLSEWPLFAVRMAVTLALATVMFVTIEQPVRERRRLLGWRPFVVAPAAFGAVVLGAVLVTWTVPAPLIPELQAKPGTPPAPAVAPTSEELADPAVRVMVVGDSAALMLGVGMTDYASTHDDLVVDNATMLGCGVLTLGEVRLGEGFGAEVPNGVCVLNLAALPKRIETFRPDVVLVMSNRWDQADRKLDDGVWRRPGDPQLDEALFDQMATLTRTLRSAGVAHVVWATAAPLFPDDATPSTEPERFTAWNALLARLAATEPGVSVLDWAGFLATRPGGVADRSVRPDGIHVSRESGAAVTAEWVAPELRRIVDGVNGVDGAR